MLDKLAQLMYNLVKLVRANIKTDLEGIEMMYFKSVYTGQVYKMGFIPMGNGWELSTEAEYLAWCKEHGIKP